MKDYIIHKDGRIWSNIKNKYLTPHSDKKGYLRVDLLINGKRKTSLLHRLLAMKFIPNPDNKPCIDHIDGNPSNNNLSNLRWCTYKENNNNPITRSRSKVNYKNPMIGKFGKDNHLSKAVLCFTKDMEFVAEYAGVREASRETGINRADIGQCCINKRKSAGNFIWKFKN